MPEDVKYSEFVGKKVTLATAKETRSGMIVAVNEMIVMFTPKGTSSPELVNVSDINTVEFIPEKPRKLNQKSLDPVSTVRVRRHLLDYHGLELERVNEWDDNEGEVIHNGLDHALLGHNHEGRKNAGTKNSDGEAEDE